MVDEDRSFIGMIVGCSNAKLASNVNSQCRHSRDFAASGRSISVG
jgi:hypothetical protein